MKTEAAVLYGLREPLILEEIEVPPLKAGQVLVQIVYSGVCRSQMGEWLGFRGEDPYLPHLLGHEGAGIVEEIGAEVTKVKVGDRVALSWMKGSGANIGSTTYRKGPVAISAGAVTTFATRAVISENRLVVMPPEMPLEAAAVLGCAVLTGAGMVLHTAKIEPGESVVVFGAGGIGLSAVMMANLTNATPIIVIDRHDHKLKRALDVGASHAVNAGVEDPAQAIRDLTHGQGVDVAIEAAGTVSAMSAAYQAVRPRGGRCVLSGNPPTDETITISPYDLMAGKALIGTSGGGADLDGDCARFVKLHLAGKVDLTKLITDRYPLQEVNQAFDDHLEGRIGRAILEMDG